MAEQEKIDVYLKRVNTVIQILLGVAGLATLALWRQITIQVGEVKLSAKLLFHCLVALAFTASVSGLSLALTNSVLSRFLDRKVKLWPIIVLFILTSILAYELAYRIGYRDY